MQRPGKDWLDEPLVQNQIRRAGEFVGRKVGLRFVESTDGAIRHLTKSIVFESPLELLFWIWWGACEWEWRDTYPYDRLQLISQLDVDVAGERFRLDFSVELNEPNFQKARSAGLITWPKIAIEVDGHAFHERTPEQVALRDRRDRLLQQDGWRVFHYSFSEFTTNPERCVEEVYGLASSAAIDAHRVYTTELPPAYRSL